MTKDIILINRHVEEKYHLKELLEPKFIARIVLSEQFDISATRQALDLVVLKDDCRPESLSARFPGNRRLPTILVSAMLSFETICKLTSAAENMRVLPFWDRFDLVDIITWLVEKQPENLIDYREQIQNTLSSLKIDEAIELIAMMTWKKEPLPKADCETLLSTFGSVSAILSMSPQQFQDAARELLLAPSTVESISTFLSGMDSRIQ